MTPTPSTPIVIHRPETADLATGHSDLMRRVREISISDQDSHAAGLELLKDAALKEKVIVERFKEPKEGAFKAHKFICEAETAILRPIRAAKTEIQGKLSTYEAEAQRKADEEARKKEAEARKLEEDRQLADAQAAEEAGDKEGAEQILNEPVSAPVVHVAPAVARVAGVTSRTTYGAIGEDLAALVCHIAGVKRLAHPELLSQVTFNTVANNQLARAMRENLNVPGLRLDKQTSKAVRSA